MSIRGKDFRGEIHPSSHEKLRQMAEFEGADMSPLGSRWLEEMIAAKWHSFSLLLERLEHSGISRRPNGGQRNKADSE